MSHLTNPAANAAAVTPSDTTVFAEHTRGLYVGTTGNVYVRMAGGNQNTVAFMAVPAGAILPICVSGVNFTSTTASNIVRLW